MANLILIRGVSGSGKSTLARKLCKLIPDTVHFEADMYFLNDSGNYMFDAAELPKAHAWCREETEKALRDGMNVIVSNTFTRAWELEAYFKLAETVLEAFPDVLVCTGPFKSIHGVPESILEAQKARFEWDISELYHR